MPLMWQNYSFNVAKLLPLTPQIHCLSKYQTSPKKVLKIFIKIY